MSIFWLVLAWFFFSEAIEHAQPWSQTKEELKDFVDYLLKRGDYS
jgi:hypothetical protein